MEPFLYLDESMHTVHHGNSRQVAQSSTQQGDSKQVLIDEDKPWSVSEDQDESENEEGQEGDSEEQVSSVR